MKTFKTNLGAILLGSEIKLPTSIGEERITACADCGKEVTVYKRDLQSLIDQFPDITYIGIHHNCKRDIVILEGGGSEQQKVPIEKAVLTNPETGEEYETSKRIGLKVHRMFDLIKSGGSDEEIDSLWEEIALEDPGAINILFRK